MLTEYYRFVITFVSVFLKEDMGAGEGENFLQEVFPFPREKKSKNSTRHPRLRRDLLPRRQARRQDRRG